MDATSIDPSSVQETAATVARELLAATELQPGDLVVLGCSSSEIIGGRIGKSSSAETGEAVVAGVLPVIRDAGLFLAVQGCEHINRSLVVEREYAQRRDLEIVTVVPALHAGGATSVAAYAAADDPVIVEHVCARAGIDIGDTEVGMHVRHVQIPLRLPTKLVGDARVTALASRPKLIGGERAAYR